jgi:hypothetical protein
VTTAIAILQVHISFILHNYVVEDVTCLHDVLEVVMLPATSRAGNHGESSLKYSKATLNFFVAGFLHFNKMPLFCCLRL